MKKTLKNIFKFLIFILVGVFLFYLVYRNFDFKSFVNDLSCVNYWWFIPVFLLFILSNASRAIRWQMLLDTSGDKTRFSNTFFAVLNAYFANLALPRLGEVTRCAVVSKYDNIGFSKALGTMVSERVTDVIMILLLTILAFALQSSEIKTFLVQNPEFGNGIDVFLSPSVIIPVVCIGAGLLYFVILIAKGKFNNIKFFEKIAGFIKGFWVGIISLKDVKRPFLFILHSIFIWVAYFLMLYFSFFAFDGFSHLNILVALTIFVASSFGMLAPSPNGMGAYHFMVIQSLLIYGINNEKAAFFALVVHAMQTLFIVIGGLISIVGIPIINKK
ncbi:flippase-like domain-containing protein [Bacteroidales bacterium OttesenSCG-928-I21]|nr:flippase-like domain-containing protein [Bacteroidales bacterium OttesenSCG-928-I21]